MENKIIRTISISPAIWKRALLMKLNISSEIEKFLELRTTGEDSKIFEAISHCKICGERLNPEFLFNVSYCEGCYPEPYTKEDDKWARWMFCCRDCLARIKISTPSPDDTIYVKRARFCLECEERDIARNDEPEIRNKIINGKLSPQEPFSGLIGLFEGKPELEEQQEIDTQTLLKWIKDHPFCEKHLEKGMIWVLNDDYC